MVRLSDSSCTYLITRLTYPIPHVLPQFLIHLSHFSITYPTLIPLSYSRFTYLLFSYSFAPSLILIPHPTYPIPHSLNPLFIHLSHSSVTYLIPHLNYVITPLFYLIPHPLIQYLIPLSVFYSLIWFFTNFSDSYSRFCFLIHLHVSLFTYPAPIRFSDVLFTSLVLHLLYRFLIIWFFIYLIDSSFTCLVHHSLLRFIIHSSYSSFSYPIPLSLSRWPDSPQTPLILKRLRYLSISLFPFFHQDSSRPHGSPSQPQTRFETRAISECCPAAIPWYPGRRILFRFYTRSSLRNGCSSHNNQLYYLLIITPYS